MSVAIGMNSYWNSCGKDKQRELNRAMYFGFWPHTFEYNPIVEEYTITDTEGLTLKKWVETHYQWHPPKEYL